MGSCEGVLHSEQTPAESHVTTGVSACWCGFLHTFWTPTMKRHRPRRRPVTRPRVSLPSSFFHCFARFQQPRQLEYRWCDWEVLPLVTGRPDQASLATALPTNRMDFINTHVHRQGVERMRAARRTSLLAASPSLGVFLLSRFARSSSPHGLFSAGTKHVRVPSGVDGGSTCA